MARNTRVGRRPDYQWDHFGDVMTAQDLSSTAGQLGTTGLLSVSAHTCVRIRGKVGVVLDTGGINESAMILCGLVKMLGDSFAAGAAPELFVAGVDEASWIWQGALYVNSGAEGAIVTDFLSDNIEADSKAMRKYKTGDEMAFVFQTPAELVVDQGGTFDLTYFFHVLRSE